MTLAQLETRLKQINPRLHVKKYGSSMAAVHLGTQHLFRVPQGEITLYSVTEERMGQNDDYRSDLNPRGLYKYNYKLRRGLGELSHLLQTGGVINSHQAAQLRNGVRN